MYVFHKPSFMVKKGIKFWRKEKRLYGDDFRVVHWNVPYISFWNRAPISIKWQWHCNTCFNNVHKGKRKEHRNASRRPYSPHYGWHRDL